MSIWLTRTDVELVNQIVIKGVGVLHLGAVSDAKLCPFLWIIFLILDGYPTVTV